MYVECVRVESCSRCQDRKSRAYSPIIFKCALFPRMTRYVAAHNFLRQSYFLSMFPMSPLPICELLELHYLSQQVTTSLLPSNTLIAPVHSGELNSSSENYQFLLSIVDVKLLSRELYCSDFGAYRSRIEAGIETWRPHSYSHWISTRQPFLTYKVVPTLLDGIQLKIGANGRQTDRWTLGCRA